MFQGLEPRKLPIVVVLVAIASFVPVRPTDIDYWWHVTTGRLIAESGRVPFTDPYSYTPVDRPWVAHEWLWELGAHLLTTLGGHRLAVLASVAIVTATYFMLYRLIRSLGVNELVASAIVLWAEALAYPSVGVRPREVAHLFVVVFLAALVRYCLAGAARLRHLPLLMVSWINLHGSFALGLAMIAVFALADLVDWWRGKNRRFPTAIVRIAMLTVAATILNPHGINLLLYPVGYFTRESNPVMDFVTEWQSPNFHSPVLVPLALGITTSNVLGLPEGRLRLPAAVLVGGITLMTLVSVRHATVYALIVGVFLAARLRERYSWAGPLPPRAVATALLVVLPHRWWDGRVEKGQALPLSLF